MMEIAAAVVGVLATAILAFGVYRYRSVITFDLTSISEDFDITADAITASDGSGPSTRLTFERLVLKNRGFMSLENVKLHLEHTPPILSAGVARTSNLSKGATKLSYEDGRLEVRLEHFPQGEEIAVELSYLGYGGGDWREVRGTGGRYVVLKDYLFKARRQGMLWGVVIGLGIVGAPVAVGFALR